MSFVASRDELRTWMHEPVQDVLRRHRDDPGLGWTSLEPGFLQRAGLRDPSAHPVTRELSERVIAMSDDDRERLLTGDALRTLVDEIVERHADPAPAAPAQPVDPALWNGFLAENGPRWNGDEQSWPEFRTWFRYHADQAGVGAPAEAFLTEAERSDKHEFFARYRITVARPVDPARWNDFLAENGPRWNGDEQSWPEFRTWFRYHADRAGVGAPAEAFLAEAERSGRHEVFARYRITVAQPAPAPTADPVAAPGVTATEPAAPEPAASGPATTADPGTPDSGTPDSGTADADRARDDGATSSAAGDLRWVTPAQQVALGRLDGARGEWRTWLPAELDALWGDWRTGEPGSLVARLDAVLPMLELPDEVRDTAAVFLREVWEPALATLEPAELDALTEQDLRAVLTTTLAGSTG